MVLRTDYYVYAYLRKSDDTPYYIGKGTRYRINQIFWSSIFASVQNTARVKLAEKPEHLDLEVELIAKYGRKKYDEGGIL